MTPDLRGHLQTTLGDAYVLGRELGGGGMSRVFVAEDAALHRRIVVKLLPPEMAAALSIARFHREIALASQLQHPHIVPLLATGETDGLPYYTMPFVEGESLRERLTRGELPIVEAVRLVREIATALAYAHDRGIVHRDIKPENVLLSGGIALVTDFGIAKAILAATTSGSGTLTGTGVAVGTPAYMSPEQISADPSVDHRTDLYALGLIAYELLAGQPPFVGRSAQAHLAAHVIEIPEPLQKRRPGVPPALAALVMRCLEKRPADRPQTAGEIVNGLDALTTPTPTSAAPSVSSKRFSWTAVLVFALCIMASGVYWLRFGRGPQPATGAASRLLIAPFENLTGDKRFDHIGRIAADRLAVLVAQRGSMDVVPPSMVLMALRDTTGGEAERLKRMSDATHAGMIVSGTVVLRGDSLAVQAQVTDARTGRIVVTLDPASGPTTDPVAAVDALGDHLLGALGIREIRILPQGYHAPKYAAYQAFAEGYERFAIHQDVFGSRPFFERAIAIDSNYTLAYQLLGRQYLNAGEYPRADSMARRIERLPQALSETERIQLDYMRAELNGDIAGLLSAQQKLVARDSSPLSLFLTGEAATYLLRPGLAIPALERSQPAFMLMGATTAAGHATVLAEAYHQAGLHDRELRTVLATRGVSPSVAALRFLRGRQLRAYAGLKQPSAALALADTMLRVTGDSTAFALMHVSTAAQEFRAHGDAATAARLLTLARAWIVAQPTRSPSRVRQIREGIVLLGSGMPDSAIARFAIAARDTLQIDGAGYLALAQLARGDRLRARTAADSLGGLKRPWMFGQNTYWRAAIMGALNERDLAVQL
ncbi:MAG: protein kinase, partial [bacterium]